MWHIVTIRDEAALKEYGQLALAAIEGGVGRCLIRTSEMHAREFGVNQRLVVTEFDSLEKALATYNSDAYQAALRVLGAAVGSAISALSRVLDDTGLNKPQVHNMAHNGTLQTLWGYTSCSRSAGGQGRAPERVGSGGKARPHFASSLEQGIAAQQAQRRVSRAIGNQTDLADPKADHLSWFSSEWSGFARALERRSCATGRRCV